MNDWKLNARTIVKLKREHRTFVIFDSELYFWDYIQLKINKAYTILGLI